MNEDQTTTTEESATAKTRVRRTLTYALGEVEQTAPDFDANGNPVPGTERSCIVLTELPPGLTESQSRNRNSIEAAVRKAVYEDGLKQFGNKQLVVVTFSKPFEVPFEEVTETKLVPPRS